MDDNLTALLIVVTVFAALVCLRYLKLRSTNAGQLNGEAAAEMARMGEIAQRLEQRVGTLERILDAEVPDWRNNPSTFYRQAS